MRRVYEIEARGSRLAGRQRRVDMKWWRTVACLLAVGAAAQAACGWESDGQSPSHFVNLQELDSSAQPGPGTLGVLVSVTALGAPLVLVSVQGGTLNDLTGGEACFGLQPSALQSFVISVHPTQQEAVVTATIGTVAKADATTDGGESLCNGRAFEPLPPSSTVVVSLGRAPNSTPDGGSSDAMSAHDASSHDGSDGDARDGAEGSTADSSRPLDAGGGA
jgi:hypothetical protein